MVQDLSEPIDNFVPQFSLIFVMMRYIEVSPVFHLLYLSYLLVAVEKTTLLNCGMLS